VWIEGFRRNLVHKNGATSTRPSAWTMSELRELMNAFNPASVYETTSCPSLLVLPTRNLPEQEPFAEVYEAYRRHLLAEARAVRNLRYMELPDASHAMVIEQPAALAGLISDFLTAG
jgi:hypothetical protein